MKNQIHQENTEQRKWHLIAQKLENRESEAKTANDHQERITISRFLQYKGNTIAHENTPVDIC